MRVQMGGPLRGIVCTTIFVLAVACAASAVTLDVLSSEKSSTPGGFVTHVFAIRNDGALDAAFDLAVAAPAGWGVFGAPGSVTLLAGEEETLFLTLTIPAGETAGLYGVTLTAVSASDPADQASATASVLVTAVNEIEILSPAGGSAAPGEWIEYAFTLTNRGNAQDAVRIEANSSRRYTVTVSRPAVQLAPQEAVGFVVRVSIPQDAAAGRDVLTVEAASTIYADVRNQVVVFTTVLPPTPEAVRGTLMEQVAGRLRLSIQKDAIDGTFDSRLTFSVSGRVVGGYFSAFVSASDPFGPDPVDVGSFSILYRRAPVTYVIGNTSKQLTDLISVSCVGGSLDLDRTTVDVSLIAGGSGDETRFGGHVALGPEEASLGLAYLELRDAEQRRSVWSATAEAEPFDDWRIRAEGALGIDGLLTSRAFFFNSRILTAGYFLNAEAFSVGTYFPGSRRDSAGVRLSQRLRMTALTLSVSLRHEWNNVIGDPAVPTLIQDALGFNLSSVPMKDGPTLSSIVEFQWDRYADLAVRSDVRSLMSFAITETSGVLPYRFSGRVVDRIDHVLDTHFRTWTFGEEIGLSIDSFHIYLSLLQERHVDVGSDLVLSSTSEVALRFRPRGALHDASLRLRNRGDEFDLNGSLYIRFVENLDITFDGAIGWNRADAEEVSFGWGIGFNASIEIPMPFLVTKGRIEGSVFIDENGNGRRDPGERPVAGAIVAAGRVEVSTDADGAYRFPPLYPDVFTLVVRGLPADAAPAGPVEVTLHAGRTLRIDLPVAPIVVVSGVVFDDRNRDGAYDENEGGFAGVRVVLRDEAGAAVADAVTDPRGAFAIRDVRLGRYRLDVDRATLPDRFAFTTSEDAWLEISAVAPAPVRLGGFVRPREVIVTFQPPTADFDFDPRDPTVGEIITFDGTLSFDFDGEIVDYAWDFDGDGRIDARGPVVEYAFFASGEYGVSLTVTDDGGNADTITYTVTVE